MSQSFCLSALLPPPAHFAFLEALGCNSREVKRAGNWQAVYQAAMRISLRNPDDLNPRTVIVMDPATADWMATMFPGCKVAPLGGIDGLPMKGKPGRPRQHDDDAERKRAHRDRYKLELHAALDLVSGGNRVSGQFPHLVNELRQQMSEFSRGKDRCLVANGRSDLDAIGGTVYSSIFNAEPLDFFPMEDTEAFIDGLKFLRSEAYQSKHMNGLISPAIFDSALVHDTKRGLAKYQGDLGYLAGQGWGRSIAQGIRPAVRTAADGDLQQLFQHASTPTVARLHPDNVAMPIAAYKAITS